MPSYSFSVNEDDILFSSQTFATLAENEYAVSMTLSSAVSDSQKGKYIVPAASYGNLSASLYGGNTLASLGSCRKSAASSYDQGYTFLMQVDSIETSKAIKSFGKQIYVTAVSTDWTGLRPMSATSFTCTLNTAYAHSYSIEEVDHGTVTTNYREGYIPEGTTVQLTPTPDEHYIFEGWISSPQITITDNSFVMPSYDVTITPVFKEIHAGYYNGSSYLQCVPMYYNGSSWIECEWKYYDGTNWIDADST